MDDHRDRILVTGATGSTGAAVAAALTVAGTPYTAMVRKQGDSSRLATPEQPLAVADFDDADSLRRALDGVTKAYLVTPSSERAQEQQVRFVEVAASVGLGHLVVLSQLAAREDSPVRFLRYHAVVEQRVRDLGIPFTFLRPNLFFQGLFAFRDMIVKNDRFFAPIGDARVSAVDVRDIGEVAAAVLTQPGHEGQMYTLTGPAAVTHVEMADALSAALGRRITYADAPPEAFATSLDGVLPPWQVDGLLEDYEHYRGDEASFVTDDVATVTGHGPRDLRSFAHDFADRFR